VLPTVRRDHNLNDERLAMKRIHGFAFVCLAFLGVTACSGGSSDSETQTSDEQLTKGASSTGTASAYAGQPCQNLYPGLVNHNPSFASATVTYDGSGCQLDLGPSACLAHAGYTLDYFQWYTATKSGFVYAGDFYWGTAPASLGSRAAGVSPADNGNPPTQISITILTNKTIGAFQPYATQTIATPSACFGSDRSL
jgi:hypothetical protein